MSNKMKLSGLTDLLKDLDVESLEGVSIEGDIELDISGGGGLNPAMAYALGHEAAQISMHVANIARMLGYPVDQLSQHQWADFRRHLLQVHQGYQNSFLQSSMSQR